jgi:GT2 family glycosyltransferase
MSTGSRPFASVLIVTYDSAAVLPGCLESLEATEGVEFESVVVDNASGDDSAGIARRAGATVIENERNEGFGRACNRGAAAARGEVIVLLNPDTTVTPDWLAIMLDHLAGHPDIAVLCPTVVAPGTEPPLRPFLEDCAALPGSAMVIPRAAWDRLGGFDEDIFLYWEDTDLCWRAWLDGTRVVKDHEALVFHVRGGSGGGLSAAAEQVRNGLYVHVKLMLWRRTAWFAGRMVAKTLLRFAQQRDPKLLGAWVWNLKHLPRTLRRRRAVLRDVPRDRRRHLLELVHEHARWQRPEAIPFARERG